MQHHNAPSLLLLRQTSLLEKKEAFATQFFVEQDIDGKSEAMLFIVLRSVKSIPHNGLSSLAFDLTINRY
jgi:hypothetical protein